MRELLGRADAAMGRLPTYRFVTVALAVLAVISVLGAIPGWVSIASPAAILATFAVAVLATALSGRAFAALLHTDHYGTSSLVTGLLLGFLLFPSLDPVGLLLVAAAGIVASASKYVLAIGGRHLLNPAAFAAFVVGLTGLSGSAWWVASPFLLPFVVVVAALVLIRIRVIGPAVLLVAVAAVLETVGQIRFGGTAGGALAATFTSTPIVFLAAFMFTEPFTLPPRRSQRWILAAVVGVLVALPYFVPFTIGTFSPSPESALLVGNLVSLAFARPVARQLRFARRVPLTDTITEFRFTPDRPITHVAGEYLELQVPHSRSDVRGTRRTLTIVSAPGDPELAVAVRMREPISSFKRSLDSLAVGATARAAMVSGAFVLPADRRLPLVLVAGGIGITPFISQLRAEVAETAAGAAPRDLVLVLRIASATEIPYRDVLAGTGARVLLIAPDADVIAVPEHWHTTASLDVASLTAVLPEPAARTAYVSGSPRFVGAAGRVLRQAGVRRIRTDAFSGY